MSSTFVAQLRARPGTVRLSSADAIDAMTIRVQVAEAWDAVRMSVQPETSVADARLAALGVLVPDARAEQYDIKLHGIIVDATLTMAQAGVIDGSTLLVIARHRRPVR